MMKRWALVQGGRIANVVLQIDLPAVDGDWVELSEPYGPGDLFDGERFSKPAHTVRRLTKLGFISRMTQAEFIGLLTAAKTDAGAEMFVKMLDWATPDADGTSVGLDDPRTIAGVTACFSAERAAQILA